VLVHTFTYPRHKKTIGVRFPFNSYPAGAITIDMKNALIMEDSVTALAIGVKLLRLAGFEVERCSTMRGAVQLLCCAEYDVVVIDVSVPEAPGREVGYGIDLIRLARSLNPAIRCIVWSGNVEHREAAEANGAAFVLKSDLDGLAAALAG